MGADGASVQSLLPSESFKGGERSGREGSACGLGAFSTRMRQQVIESVSELSKPMRKRVMRNIGETLKEAAVADPDMCEVVKTYTKRSIGLFWADLTAYVNIALDDTMEQAANSVEHAHLAALGDKPCILGPSWWRARVLYCFLPFDKSIFGQIKDPLFWVFTVLSMITNRGIRIGFYSFLLVFILMEDPDEFQLVQYITQLKGTFFLSAGVIAGVRTAWGYLMCVHPGGCHTCDIDGPAYALHLSTAAVDLFGSGALTWAAFACLRWSVHHGWHKVEAKDLEAGSHHSHGGHLGQLFLYDFVCILVSAVVFWFLALADSDMKEAHQYAVLLRDQLCRNYGVEIHKRTWDLARLNAGEGVTHTIVDWDYHRAFLFARMFYALLSTPFVLFKLPGLNTVLTHTTMTGYNRQGRCVIFCMPPMK